MLKRRLLPLLLTMGCLPCAGAGFEALALPGSQLAALSADGRSAAGGLVDGRSGGFRWHQGAPPELLSTAISARAISASGNTVAGTSLDADHREVATWWDAGGMAHPLGGINGADAQAGVLSTAYAVTDEPRVIGIASSARHTDTAFDWTAATGMRPLDGLLPASGAAAISSDGMRLFGWTGTAGALRHATYWSDLHAGQSGPFAPLSEFIGANRAGTLALGIERDTNGLETPFRWSLSGPTEPIAIPSSLTRVRFGAASDDGRVLAGTAGSGAQRIALVWTARRGVETLADHLAARSIAVPAGWTLIAATAISADGRRLGGFGLKDGRFDSFVIDLSSIDDASRSSTVRYDRHPPGDPS